MSNSSRFSFGICDYFRLIFTTAGLLLSISIMFTSVTLAQGKAEVNLPDAARGEAAIAALGAHLPEVANENAMSPEKLREFFRTDSSLHLDTRNQKLLYVEEALEGEVESAPEVEDSSVWDSIPAANAFLLNSKPGSNRTIYLDFNGHNSSGSAWGTYDAPPFDLDGSPTSFSDSERNRIIGIWRRVAEDYAPFDVNVTTEDHGEAAITRSSSSDQVFGTRAVITLHSSQLCSSCGGVAYVGVFDSTGNYYQPAWVFYNKLGNGNEKYTAEAISHEVGHNVGLSHDGASGTSYYQGHGSGQTGWAPIMGVGYYQNLTQWSKGEYAGANNTQDDYQVMTQNQLLFRADDHGNTGANATLLNQGSTFVATGFIEQRSDKDYFRFQVGAGEVSIDVDPIAGGPNLDVKLSVFDAASGNLVAQANPTDLLDASLIFEASEGSYYLSVEGTGKGDPSTGYSDYGSLGNYTVYGTVTTPSGNEAPAALAEASTLSGQAPLSVSFDGSGSIDPDGFIASYQWDFGDGATASGVSANHSFAQGSWTVTLTVFDDDGFADTDTLTITATEAPNVPPTAVASANKTSGLAPLQVNFSSSGSSDSDGSIVSFLWQFGDGQSSGSQNPSHTYTSPGTYTATLTVTDNDGDTGVDTISIVAQLDPNYIAAPSGLSASASGFDAVLSWNDNANNETGYRVYRGVESGKGKNKIVSWGLADELPSNSNSYTDTGLSDGTYQYYVEAYHSTNSAVSDTVQVKIGGGGKGGGGKGNSGKGGTKGQK